MRRRPTYLTTEQAAAVYDRIGRWQDTQAFYESRAVEDLVRSGDFEQARSVVEVGCGTGALAEQLLSRQLPEDATYLGLDVSSHMVSLARDRVRPWTDVPASSVSMAAPHGRSRTTAVIVWSPRTSSTCSRRKPSRPSTQRLRECCERTAWPSRR